MIESSIAAQYGIRLRAEPDMTWDEFTTLLAGILPETPLGYIVGIRSENDREKLKGFTVEQKQIRSSWRSKQAKQVQPTMDAKATVQEIQRMIQSMFGGGGEHV